MPPLPSGPECADGVMLFSCLDRDDTQRAARCRVGEADELIRFLVLRFPPREGDRDPAGVDRCTVDADRGTLDLAAGRIGRLPESRYRRNDDAERQDDRKSAVLAEVVELAHDRSIGSRGHGVERHSARQRGGAGSRLPAPRRLSWCAQSTALVPVEVHTTTWDTAFPSDAGSTQVPEVPPAYDE